MRKTGRGRHAPYRVRLLGAALAQQTCTALEEWLPFPHLHGVNSDVHTALQESIINLLGEKALATNVSKGLVKHFITRSLNNNNLNASFLAELGEVLLQ